MLAMLRRLPAYDGSVRSHQWDAAGVGGAMTPLSEATVGLIGLGRIGSEVRERLRPFGCRVVVHDPFLVAHQAEALGVELVALESLLADADAISLHAPLTPASQHLLGADSLALVKPTAVIVNTSRGPLIDTEALAAALRDGRLGGAALDVFEEEPLPADSPLRDCPQSAADAPRRLVLEPLHGPAPAAGGRGGPPGAPRGAAALPGEDRLRGCPRTGSSLSSQD